MIDHYEYDQLLSQTELMRDDDHLERNHRESAYGAICILDSL